MALSLLEALQIEPASPRRKPSNAGTAVQGAVRTRSNSRTSRASESRSDTRPLQNGGHSRSQSRTRGGDGRARHHSRSGSHSRGGDTGSHSDCATAGTPRSTDPSRRCSTPKGAQRSIKGSPRKARKSWLDFKSWGSIGRRRSASVRPAGGDRASRSPTASPRSYGASTSASPTWCARDWQLARQGSSSRTVVAGLQHHAKSMPRVDQVEAHRHATIAALFKRTRSLSLVQALDLAALHISASPRNSSQGSKGSRSLPSLPTLVAAESPIVLRVAHDVWCDSPHKGQLRQVGGHSKLRSALPIVLPSSGGSGVDSKASGTQSRPKYSEGEYLLLYPPPRAKRAILEAPLLRVARPTGANEHRRVRWIPRSAVVAERLGPASVGATHVLYGARGRRYLRRHLETEMSAEHIDFWESAAVIAQLRCHELVSFSADKIIRKFLQNGCPCPVNLSAAVRDRILAAHRSGDVSPHMFSEAKHEVHKLIERDSFLRFRKSVFYEALMREEAAALKALQKQPATTVASGQGALDPSSAGPVESLSEALGAQSATSSWKDRSASLNPARPRVAHRKSKSCKIPSQMTGKRGMFSRISLKLKAMSRLWTGRRRTNQAKRFTQQEIRAVTRNSKQMSPLQFPRSSGSISTRSGMLRSLKRGGVDAPVLGAPPVLKPERAHSVCMLRSGKGTAISAEPSNTVNAQSQLMSMTPPTSPPASNESSPVFKNMTSHHRARLGNYSLGSAIDSSPSSGGRTPVGGRSPVLTTCDAKRRSPRSRTHKRTDTVYAAAL